LDIRVVLAEARGQDEIQVVEDDVVFGGGDQLEIEIVK